MPQLIALALVGGVVWIGYRALKRELAKIQREAQKHKPKAPPKTILQEGEDGVYRPVEKKED